jgi:hypothetical protein
MKVAIAIAALCIASASAGYNAANSPSYSSDASFWTRDDLLSFNFNNGLDYSALFTNLYYNDGCTKFQESQGKCTIEWHGMQPAVYDEANIENNHANEIRLKVDSSTTQSLFDAANALDNSDCSCEYQDYTSGLMRSRNSYRSGIQCVMLKMGDNDKTVVSLWKQSQTEEVNGVYLYTNDDGDVMLKTEAFYFEDGDTVSSASAETQVPTNIKQNYAEICEEWLNNDDIKIYYNGNFLHKIDGSEWRPNAPSPWEREEHYVNLDITLNENADVSDTAATINNAFVNVKYIHTFEPECVGLNTPSNVEYQAIGSKVYGGPMGTSTDCSTGIAGDFCESYGPRELCDNPSPGSAAETWWDLANRGDSTAVDICGFINHKAVCADPDISTRDASLFNGGRGGLNKCWWDSTDHPHTETRGTNLGKCKPWAPQRWKIGSLNKKKCTEQASTKRYTQWCFNTCGMQTAINFDSLTGQTVGTAWKTICAGHNMGYDYKTSMDACEFFTHESKNITTKDGAPFVDLTFKVCSGGKKSSFFATESPSFRRNTCYRKWFAENKAPYEIEMPGGAMEKPTGYYCVPLTSAFLKEERFAILNPGEQAACDWIGGTYTCSSFPNKAGDTFKKRCIPPNSSIQAEDASNCA